MNGNCMCEYLKDEIEVILGEILKFNLKLGSNPIKYEKAL